MPSLPLHTEVRAKFCTAKFIAFDDCENVYSTGWEVTRHKKENTGEVIMNC